MSRTFAVLPLLLATAGLLPTPEAAAQSGAAACTASAATLGAARAAYADRCALPRVDCDPSNGGWTCSSERIGARAAGGGVPAPVIAAAEPVAPSVVEPPLPAPSVADAPAARPSGPVAAREGGACAASGPDLGSAKARYAERCSAPRLDCDPANGAWTCASYRIGLNAPGQIGTAAPSAPSVPTSRPAPVSPVATPAPGGGLLKAEAESGIPSAGWESEGSYLIWRGTPDRYALASRRDDANIAYTLDVPEPGRYRFTMRSAALEGPNPKEPPNDVWVTFGDVPWTKAYMPRDRAWHVAAIGERGGRHTAALLESDLPAGPVTVTISGRSTGHAIDWIALQPLGGTTAPAPAPTPSANPTAGGGGDDDLIALHFDSSYDPDDLQAMVAMRHILDRYPERDVVAVNGTITYRHDGVVPGSLELARRLFPGTIDALGDASATDKVATAWQLTLEAGGKVLLAEAGPSDFTAGVLTELRSRGVGNLKNVVVVQHSRGWNQSNTRADNLETVRRLATYVLIDDGNFVNGTPDFLEAPGGAANRFIEAASRTRYGAEWRIAFDKLKNSARPVDFSDTVELMHILGIPTSDARDATGFAARFF